MVDPLQVPSTLVLARTLFASNSMQRVIHLIIEPHHLLDDV